MQLLYFLTLENQHLRIREHLGELNELEQGFMYGEIFIPSWAICRNRSEAEKLLLTAILETGADADL